MLSLQQLRQSVERSDVSSWLIATLQKFGYQTTGWQPGRIQHTILNAISSAGAAFAEVATVLVGGVLNGSATGVLLTEYSAARFSNTRSPALAAQGTFLFANATAAPIVLAAGQLLIQDSSGTQFSNLEPGTVPAGGTLEIECGAVLKGANGNIGNSSTLSLITSVAGLSVTNPGPGAGVAWYTTQAGADAELDSELQTRNAAKWGLLAIEKTETAMVALALAQSGVAKAKVVTGNPRGPFTVDVYVAGATSLVSTAQITAAQAAFADYTFQTESVWPPTDSPEPSAVRLYHPTTLELVVEGAVYYDPALSSADVATELSSRLTALVASVGIGGTSYAVGVSGRLTLGDILEVIEGTRGVRSASLTTPTGDVTIGSTTLLTPPSDWITGKITLAPALT